MSNKQPTAAIYNRWLFTLGGGEQVAFAYAETLRDLGYKTTILTHKEVDIKAARKKMNVNLSDIRIEYIPLQNSNSISRYTEEFDVFINTSYLDYFPNRGKKGILSVFFPGEIYLSPLEYLKRSFVIPALRNFFIYPTQFEGFVSDEFKNNTLHKWLGEKSSVYFTNHQVTSIEIDLHFPTFSFSTVETVTFYINDAKVFPTDHTLNHTSNSVRYHFLSNEPITRFSIIKSNENKDECISLTKLTIPSIRYILYNFFKSFFPKWEMRLHGGPSITPLSDLTSYQSIVTISEFCKYWIHRYWGLPSTVIYPPVNISSFHPAKKKQNIIAHVGRFFVTGHSKKQLELIKIFKKLMDTEGLQHWELHLAGTIHEGKKHQQYFESCKAEAAGYPVFFHIGLPFEELRTLLAKSKIYWHATGLDEDQKKQPILMEHFGITTVEAMATGCVPVVINAGGQPEIVTSDSGFVWNTRDELIEITRKLTKNPHLLNSLSKGAQIRSKHFSREAFKQRFSELIKNLDTT